MGLFKSILSDVVNSAVRREVNRAVDEAVDKAVDKAFETAVRPAAEQLASEAAGAAANTINAAAGAANTAAGDPASSREDYRKAFSYLEGMANDMMKDVRVCPGCGEGVKGDQKFCPKCGTKLPEKTLSELALCPNCGRQNPIGTAFCSECGAKLPSKIAEDERAAAVDASVLARWETDVPAFPKWDLGGTDYELSEIDPGQYIFSASFSGNSYAAERAVEQYRAVCESAGFVMAGEYKSREHLYKMENGVCWHVDTEHCFEGDSDCPSFGLLRGEPRGGFYYTKPAEKKKNSIFGGLFG